MRGGVVSSRCFVVHRGISGGVVRSRCFVVHHGISGGVVSSRCFVEDWSSVRGGIVRCRSIVAGRRGVIGAYVDIY